MRYLLDTDTTSLLIRGNPAVVKKAQLHLGAWAISAITAAEISTWLLGRNVAHLEEKIVSFLEEVDVLQFGSQAGLEFGKIQTGLKAAKKNMQNMDALIAAHAVSQNLTLVTNNTKDFKLVENLALENWLK